MPLPEPVEDLIEVGALARAKARHYWMTEPDELDRAQARGVLQAVADHPDWAIVRRQEIEALREALLDAHKAFLAMRAVYTDTLLDPEEETPKVPFNEYAVAEDFTLDYCTAMANNSEMYREYAGSFDEGWLPALGWSYDYDTDTPIWKDPGVAALEGADEPPAPNAPRGVKAVYIPTPDDGGADE